jgi:predicted nucleic acid-binding Zn ribbon protein
MPTYTAKCPVCGRVQDYVKKINERDDVPHCNRYGCGGYLTERVIMTPILGVVDNPAFMKRFKHMY